MLLKDLVALKARLADRPPVAVKMYFVDRPALLERLMDAIPLDPSLSEGLYVTGIQVFKVNSATDKDRLPECCGIPGVWVEMSDGTFKAVKA